MDWLNFVLGVLTLLLAGVNIFQFIFLKQTRKKYIAEADKAKASAKADEIDNMRKALEDFYNPLLKAQDDRIASQNVRIAELETEVKTLRDEKRQTEDRHQQEIAELRKQNADLQKQITDITRALGIKAAKQLRNGKGQFTSEKEAK